MADGALVAAVFAASYLGCALLALRQKQHFRCVSAQPVNAPPSAALRARLLNCGSISLALGSCCSWLAQGPSFGSLLWILALGSASVAVTFTLTWRPHWLRPVLRGVSVGVASSGRQKLSGSSRDVAPRGPRHNAEMP